jgi:uncharacterized membrane protein YhdT
MAWGSGLEILLPNNVELSSAGILMELDPNRGVRLMIKLNKEQQHDQCMREIKGTLIVVSACCLWHISTAFILNGTGLFFLGMPAWFSVSVFGTIVIALVGVRVLLKKVFIDFEYDAESDEDEAAEEVSHE